MNHNSSAIYVHFHNRTQINHFCRKNGPLIITDKLLSTGVDCSVVLIPRSSRAMFAVCALCTHSESDNSIKASHVPMKIQQFVIHETGRFGGTGQCTSARYELYPEATRSFDKIPAPCRYVEAMHTSILGLRPRRTNWSRRRLE